MRVVPTVISFLILSTPVFSSPARCTLCTSTLAELQLAYQDTQTQDLISIVVEGLCEVVPIFDCVNYVEVYLNSFTTTVLQMNPAQECASFKLCPGNNEVSTELRDSSILAGLIGESEIGRLGKVNKCKVCANAADLVIDVLKNPTLEAVVDKALKMLCDVLKRGPQCKTAVDEYLDMLIKLITMKDLSGETLCDWVFFNVLGVDCNFP